MKYHSKVIQFPQSPPPAHWTFYDYVQGTNPIQEWYEGLSDTGKFLFHDILKTNQKTELPIHWQGFKRFLQGKARRERIWELQFVADKRQYRVFGIFGDVRKQAVILLGCFHKSKVYDPPDAIETAYKRARALKERKATIHERQIRTDL